MHRLQAFALFFLSLHLQSTPASQQIGVIHSACKGSVGNGLNMILQGCISIKHNKYHLCSRGVIVTFCYVDICCVSLISMIADSCLVIVHTVASSP